MRQFGGDLRDLRETAKECMHQGLPEQLGITDKSLTRDFFDTDDVIGEEELLQIMPGRLQSSHGYAR